MPRIILKIFIVALLFGFTGCAKRGNISGGLKDTIPPVLRSAVPKNYSTGFKGNEIRLEFNEYVKLKNINKQLIVSPPMKKAPDVSPLVASKTIRIRIYDTLQPNTTYSFNFGQSIEDNNESIPLPQFKYVFSTGSYIDSLTLGGTIKDAYNKTSDPYVSVMLYEINDTYTDSIIYKESPRYITNTLDSLTGFKFENLKAGRYQLIAVKDVNSNYRFDPKTDKIGFQKQYVTVPGDTIYELELFQETLPFKAVKPTLGEGNKLVMGYEGNPSGITATLRNGGELLPAAVTRIPKKDSLHIWYKPVKADSIQVVVNQENYTKEFFVKIKAQKQDTLRFSPKPATVLPLRGKFSVESTRPLIKFDPSLMKVINKDSLAVPFTTSYNNMEMTLEFDFEKQPLERYNITLLPGAVTDFYEKSNDSLSFTVTTKNTSDYGNLRVTLQNVRKFPVIVEILDAKGEVVASQYSESASTIDFIALDPAIYTLRLIYDENGNKIWDTGSFLQKLQSEEVIYFPKEIPVRANWDVDQPFSLP